MNRRDFAKSTLVAAGLCSVAVAEVEKPKEGVSMNFEFTHIEILNDRTVKQVRGKSFNLAMWEAGMFALRQWACPVTFISWDDAWEVKIDSDSLRNSIEDSFRCQIPRSSQTSIN